MKLALFDGTAVRSRPAGPLVPRIVDDIDQVRQQAEKGQRRAEQDGRRTAEEVE